MYRNNSNTKNSLHIHIDILSAPNKRMNLITCTFIYLVGVYNLVEILNIITFIVHSLLYIVQQIFVFKSVSTRPRLAMASCYDNNSCKIWISYQTHDETWHGCQYATHKTMNRILTLIMKLTDRTSAGCGSEGICILNNMFINLFKFSKSDLTLTDIAFIFKICAITRKNRFGNRGSLSIMFTLALSNSWGYENNVY